MISDDKIVNVILSLRMILDENTATATTFLRMISDDETDTSAASLRIILDNEKARWPHFRILSGNEADTAISSSI